MIQHLQLRDRGDNILRYIDINTLATFKRTEYINGKHVLSMEFAPDAEYISELVKYNKILFKDSKLDKWFEFVIASVTSTVKSLKVELESSFYSTLSCFIPFVDITGNTVINGMYKLFNYAYPASDWSVGTSDITGSYYMQRTRSTLKDALIDWAAKVGGEIIEEITVDGNNNISRTVSIYKRRGNDNGVCIYDDREITDFTRALPQGDIFTAAYGFGNYDTDSNAITFTDIEWSTANGDPVDKPAGQAYVSLGQSVINQFGNLVNGEYVDRCTVVSVDSELPETILQRTYEALIANIADPTTYTVKVADFAALGINDNAIDLGDTVGVIVNALDIKFKTRAVSKVTDYLNPSNNTFEFNTKPALVTKTLNSIAKTAEAAERTANESYYAGVLEKFNREINADQAYVFADPINGFNTYNTSSPATATKVTSIKGGSLRIANGKTQGNWDWTTVITGDGLVVNEATTNKITGENFELDLISGLLSFGPRVNGSIQPVMQLQTTGFTILGDDTNAVFTPAKMGFINNASGEAVAEFASDGAHIPTAIIDSECRIGGSRIIPTNNDADVMWAIND